MTKHNIVEDGLSPHNGEYWYKCTKCGKSDWIAFYGDLRQLNFYDEYCIDDTKSSNIQSDLFKQTFKRV
jgi:hypothetical protein